MNTMKMIGGFAAIGLTTAAFADALQPEPEPELMSNGKSPISVELSMDVLSDYMWRGMIGNDNPVWQPSVTLGYDLGDCGSVSANIWSTFDLTHKRGSATNSRRADGLQEIDYTLSYSVTVAGVGLEAGHIWYAYPNNNGSTDQELYATVSYETDYVTPSASAYWNYSDSAGNDVSCVYYQLALKHEFNLESIEGLTITPSASLGFGGNAWTDCGTELSDQTIGVAAAYAITDNVSVGAQLNYTWIPSHALRVNDYMGEGKDQLLWGGVNVTLSF